jgi:alpha-galactosidase
MQAEGVRPGIWVRPLIAPDHTPASLCLPDERFKSTLHHRFLDPSLPEALERVRADIACLAEWGYQLIKHDYTTFDILGRWGFEMAADLTNTGWHFQDTSKTTAEIIIGLYQVIRQAAGNSQIIGCNTVGHLAAGLVEMQRTGDDTSGRQWERTRKMGVNTLAFTLAKHGTFFAVDADCAGITADIPWELNRQWLDVLARSGTPLFVSASPGTGDVEKQAIREAFALAAQSDWPTEWPADWPVGTPSAGPFRVEGNHDEPLDWMDTTCPAQWKLRGELKTYAWHRDDQID